MLELVVLVESEVTVLDSIESWETASWLLGTLMTWPICRSVGVTPGLAASIAATVVPYSLAMVQKVSSASAVIWLVLVAIVPPGTTATTKSQHAARAKVISKGLRILARTRLVNQMIGM